MAEGDLILHASEKRFYQKVRDLFSGSSTFVQIKAVPYYSISS
jgi:hypothetical protein